jgi:predicted nuclease of restriction endonuclease-like (RecB) superfamily
MAEKIRSLETESILKVIPEDYKPILEAIVNKVKDAQARAIKAVHFELVSVYREIGQIIHDKQSQSEWGSSIVERLAQDLKNRFPGIKGFSSRNLWRMKDFYLSYCKKEKLTALLAEISWTHHVYILERCKDPLEREFYIRMSKRNGWSYRTLLNHIESKTFETMMASQENFEASLSAA